MRSERFLRIPFIMEDNIAFNPINVTFFGFVRIMLHTNNITDLFKELFRGFVHRRRVRNFRDSTTIRYVIPKVSGYLRKMYGKFLDNILYREIIQKVSVFCPLGIDYPEKVSIINS